MTVLGAPCKCWKCWVYSCLNDQVYLPTFSCAFFGRLVGKYTNSSILWELLTKPPPQGQHFHPSVPLNSHAQAFASEPDTRLACLDAGARMLAPGVKAVKPALAKVRLEHPFWEGSNKQQIYGNFEGFLLNNKQQIYELRGMPFWWSFSCFTLENFAFFSATEGPHQQDLSGWTMANISDGSHHPKPNTSGLLTPGMSVIRRWNHFAK